MRNLLALLAGCLLLPAIIWAQNKNLNITPAPTWLAPYHPDLEKKPDTRDISDGFYLLLSEEQNNAAQNEVYHHIIRQIVSEAGIQNGAEISADYDPVYEKLHFHQIIIRRNGQVINKLQPNGFKILQQEEELSRFVYSGVYTAYYLLEDVRKGDQIEYAYTLEGSNPIFDHKYSNFFYLGAPEPVVNLYKNVLVSPGRDIRFKSFNGAPLPVKQSWQGLQLYEWKMTNPPAMDDPDHVPSWYVNYPFIQASEYRQWQEIADWGVRISTPPPPGPLLQARIAELKKEAGNNKDLYLQKATRFVQDDIRYMGVEMGEYSHRPNTPDKILSQRFGDCKDKALLLATLLNADSIPASIAYLSTYYKGHVEEYLPTPDLFNHAIVYTEIKDKPLWIDATISYQRGPASMLTIPDYGKGLIVRPGTTGLTPINNHQDGQLTVVETFTLPEHAYKPGALKVSSLYTLQYADDERETLATESRKDLEKSFTDYYKKTYPGLSADTVLQVNDNEVRNELETIEQYQLPQNWKTDSTDNSRLTFTVRAGLLQGILPPYGEEDTAHTPLGLRYPYTLDYTVALDMPADWTFNEPDVHIKNDYYQFDFSASVIDNHVRLHYFIKTFNDHIPSGYLGKYRKDLSNINDVCSYNLYWNPDVASSGNTPGQQANWLTIGLALAALAFFIYQAALFYRRSLPVSIEISIQQMPIQGWLAVLMLWLVGIPLLAFSHLVKNPIFHEGFWKKLETMPNATGSLSLLQLLLVTELAVSIGLFVYSILVAILFFKRRDIFPPAMTIFLLVQVIFSTVDIAVFHFVYKQPHWDEQKMAGVIISLLAGVVITPYLKRSWLVKETFVVPYRQA